MNILCAVRLRDDAKELVWQPDIATRSTFIFETNAVLRRPLIDPLLPLSSVGETIFAFNISGAVGMSSLELSPLFSSALLSWLQRIEEHATHGLRRSLCDAHLFFCTMRTDLHASQPLCLFGSESAGRVLRTRKHGQKRLRCARRTHGGRSSAKCYNPHPF